MQTTPEETSAAITKKVSFTSVIVVGCLVLIIIGIFVYTAIFELPGPSGTPSDAEAIMMSRTFVRDRLYAPSPQFSGVNETQVTAFSDRRWRVAGWVEAQNLFGTIRKRYVCIMKYEGKNQWRLTDLRME